MEAWKLRAPILRRRILGDDLLELELRLILRTASPIWEPVTFLFDTGSQFTTLSISLAERLHIPFSRACPVQIQGTTGIARGFMSPLWFRIPGLDDIEFGANCCISSAPMSRSLLSLTDVLRHFTMRTLLPSQLHPLGSVLLRLRDDHQGVPRL